MRFFRKKAQNSEKNLMKNGGPLSLNNGLGNPYGITKAMSTKFEMTVSVIVVVGKALVNFL